MIPLDLLFYADHGVDLIGQTVRRWHPIKGKAFLEQVEASARPKLVLSGLQPCIRFKGKHHLNFRGFGSEKGPHSFFFVCQTKKGTLLDSQANDILIPAPKAQWQVYEVIQDSALPINETALGSDYYGKTDFLHGDIAAFGYQQGILHKGQREAIHALLSQKLGEVEKGFWTIRINKPRWFLQCLNR